MSAGGMRRDDDSRLGRRRSTSPDESGAYERFGVSSESRAGVPWPPFFPAR